MTPLKQGIAEPEVHTEEDMALLPKPGSPANEVLAWWGRRLLERSRKFAAQREEGAHRGALARLKQSLRALPLDEDEDEPALAACLYILIPCPRCGEVRQALGDYPEQVEVVCPECGLECEFVALGVGLTRKPAPFHELHAGIAVDMEGKARIPWDELPCRRKRAEEDDAEG